MTGGVDPQAFGTVADAYERGRPGYPAEAIERAWSGLGLGPGAAVLDLGAGTGKLTASLAQRAERVLAVEPVAAMRERLEASLRGVAVLAGEATAIPLPDGAVDAVFTGEAFHWFATPAALDEIARVLRGGGIAMLWNVPRSEEEDDALGREVWAVLDGLRDGVDFPRAHPGGGGEWRRAFQESPRFGPIEEAHFPHRHILDRDGVLANTASISWLAAAPEDRRAPALEEIAAALDRHLAPGATVAVPYRTDVHWALRRPEP